MLGIGKTLTKDCYGSMFKGCFGLLEAPQLPATQLESYCYEKMFEQCTSLTKMPELPALSLGNHCYFSMFKSCLSLTDVAPLPATALARNVKRLAVASEAFLLTMSGKNILCHYLKQRSKIFVGSETEQLPPKRQCHEKHSN